MNIVLLAHHETKRELVKFVRLYLGYFHRHALIATDSTAKALEKNTNLTIRHLPIDPQDGGESILGMVMNGDVGQVFVFRNQIDSLFASVETLIQACIVKNVPLSLNESTAKAMIASVYPNGTEQTLEFMQNAWTTPVCHDCGKIEHDIHKLECRYAAERYVTAEHCQGPEIIV